jgi:hypothetical protein
VSWVRFFCFNRSAEAKGDNVETATSTTNDLPPLLTKTELAKLYRVTIKSIDNWLSARLIPQPIRFNCKKLWPRDVVLRDIEERARKAQEANHAS